MPSPIGAISKPQAIAKWIIECMTDEVTTPGGQKTDLTHIALCHSPSDKEIYVQPMKGKAADEHAVMTIAGTIHGRAEADADGMPGRQTYVLYAFYEGCNNAWSRRKVLQVNGKILNEHGDHSTEPATAEGRAMQRMRHDEAYSQTLVQANLAILQKSIDFGSVMADRAMQSEVRYGEMFLKMQSLLMDMSLNHQKEERERAEYERNTKLLEQAAKMAPALLNTITGREIVPQATADTAIVEAFADALDPETTQKVIAALGDKVPPAAMGVLFARLQELAEKKQRGLARVEDALAKRELDTDAEMGVNGSGTGIRSKLQ